MSQNLSNDPELTNIIEKLRKNKEKQKKNHQNIKKIFLMTKDYDYRD